MKKKLLLVLLTIALVFCAIGAGAIVASAETVAPEMRIAFCNLSFRDSVCIKYAVKTDVSNVKILLWTSPRAEYTVGTQDGELTKSYNEVISGVTHKVFDYTALSAKQMTDVIYARAYAKVDGVDCYSDVTKYSILQYAYNKLGKTATASSDADLKELLANMLAYGASAQKYFDYNEDRLATADWYQVKLTQGLLDDGSTFGLYLPGDTVTLTAPEKAENGDLFSHWADQNGNQVATTAAYELTVGTANKVYTPAYAHIPAVDAAVAPTCVETGLTEGSHCAACGEVLVAQEVVAATGVHTFGEWVTVKEPTKKEEGLAERTCYCGEKETQAVEKIQPVLSYALNDDGQSYTVTGVGEWTAAEFGDDLTIPSVHEGLPVTRIGNEAFVDADIESVVIPDSVTHIGDYAFKGSDLETINIPDSVTYVGVCAFEKCYPLSSVYIGSGVTGIGGHVFFECNCLRYIGVSPNNATYYSSGNCVINKTTNALVVGGGDAVIPEGVTTIAEYAFADRYALTSITIPGSVTKIYAGAFDDCNCLESVTFSEGVSKIDDSAFLDCFNLKSVTIPASVTSIGSFAFSYCRRLEEITYGGTIAQWGAVTKGSDWNYNTGEFVVICTEGTACKNHNVVIDAAVAPTCAATGLTEGSHCSGCGKVIVAQNTVAALAHQVAVTTVTEKTETFYTVSNSSTYPFTVSGNQITSTNKASNSSATYTITAKKAFTLALEYKVSSEANYDKLTINHNSTNKVTTSGTTATEFTSLNIAMSAGDTVTITYTKDGSLDKGSDCAWVNILTAKTQTTTTEKTEYVTVTESNRESLASCTEDRICAVCGGVAIEKIVPALDYTLNSDGQSYAVTGIGSWDQGTLVIPSTYEQLPVTGIAGSAFKNNTVLTDIVIPDSVTSIGANAFRGCTNLKNISIPDSITSVGLYAFDECGALTYKQYGNAYYLGNAEKPYVVLMKATSKSITSCSMSNDTKAVYYEAFYGCSSLNKVVISPNLKYVGRDAFCNCNSLEGVYISDLAAWSKIQFAWESDWDEGYWQGSHANPLRYANKLYLNGARITDLVVPASVTALGDYAFHGGEFNTVTLPDGITYIPDGAFRGCTMKSIYIPDSVRTIEYYAFYGCNNLEMLVMNNVTSIADYALCNCSGLKAIYSLSKPAISSDPDDGNDSHINKFVTGYSCVNVNGAIYGIKDGTATLLYVPSGLVTFEILSSVEYKGVVYSVTAIGEKVFYYNSKITNITIPDSVTSIGKYGFAGCEMLTGITLPNSITKIDEYTFYECTGLTSVVIPDSVTTIGSRAFGYCKNLASVTIPDSVVNIETYAFYGCSKLVEVINKSSLVITVGDTGNGYVGYYAKEIHAGQSKLDVVDGFMFYSLDGINYLLGYAGTEGEITLPVSYKGQEYAFFASTFASNNSLIGITIPGSITQIPDGMFSNCEKLTSVTICDGVKSIGNSAFAYCSSLTSVTIPNSVTSLGSDAFRSCRKLTTITIGDGVTSVGAYAFYDCSSLVNVTLGKNVTELASYAFYGCSSLASVTIPDGVTTIGDFAFYKCTNLTNITMPASLAKMGREVFRDSKKISNVYISDLDAWLAISFADYDSNPCYNGVTVYLNGAVLTNLTIPDTVTKINAYAFRGCKSLTSVTIGNKVTGIYESAFYGCTNMKKVIISDSVKYIGIYAFRGCSSLADVTFGSSVTNIDQCAFYDCTSLAEIIIPDSVTSISYQAFYNCSSLASVTIGNSVTEIGGKAFYNCKKITSITIPASVTVINQNAFSGCSSLTSAVFETTYQWWALTSSTGGGFSISESVVANASTAARYLTSTYCDRYWTLR